MPPDALLVLLRRAASLGIATATLNLIAMLTVREKLAAIRAKRLAASASAPASTSNPAPATIGASPNRTQVPATATATSPVVFKTPPKPASKADEILPPTPLSKRLTPNRLRRHGHDSRAVRILWRDDQLRRARHVAARNVINSDSYAFMTAAIPDEQRAPLLAKREGGLDDGAGGDGESRDMDGGEGAAGVDGETEQDGEWNGEDEDRDQDEDEGDDGGDDEQDEEEIALETAQQEEFDHDDTSNFDTGNSNSMPSALHDDPNSRIRDEDTIDRQDSTGDPTTTPGEDEPSRDARDVSSLDTARAETDTGSKPSHDKDEPQQRTLDRPVLSDTMPLTDHPSLDESPDFRDASELPVSPAPARAQGRPIASDLMPLTDDPDPSSDENVVCRTTSELPVSPARAPTSPSSVSDDDNYASSINACGLVDDEAEDGNDDDAVTSIHVATEDALTAPRARDSDATDDDNGNESNDEAGIVHDDGPPNDGDDPAAMANFHHQWQMEQEHAEIATVAAGTGTKLMNDFDDNAVDLTNAVATSTENPNTGSSDDTNATARAVTAEGGEGGDGQEDSNGNGTKDASAKYMENM